MADNPVFMGSLSGAATGITLEEVLILIQSLVGKNSIVASGGGVTWESGLTFTVAACSYYIQGVAYTSLQAEITLNAADPTDPRIDIIGVNTSSVAFFHTGTPAADPSEPDTDPLTELQLAFVLVDAGATTPASVTQVVLYAENVGGPTEWNWSTSGSGFNVNSGVGPRTGSTVIAGTAVAVGAYTQGQKASGGIDISAYTSLVFYIKNVVAWNANRILTVTWYSSGVKKGNSINIQNGSFGFSTSNLTDYQAIIIPTLQFAIPGSTTVNQLRIAGAGSGGTHSFRIDDINLQSGAVQVIQGLTQAQADARYIRYV